MVLVTEVHARAINASLLALNKPNTILVTNPLSVRGVNVALNSVSDEKNIVITELTTTEINSVLLDLH